MKAKFLVNIGYTQFVFDDKDTAMRLYSLFTDSVPVTTVYCFGADKAPESLKDVCYVRENGPVPIELKRVDVKQFAMHLTEAEYRQKCKPQPTEVDGEVRVIEEAPATPVLEGPSGEDDVVDADLFI